MKLQLITVLSAIVAVVNAGDLRNQARHARIARQDSATPLANGALATGSLGSSAAPSASTPPGSSAVVPTPSALPSNLPSPPAGDISVPPLPSITSGMPTAATLPVTATYTPGAVPSYTGALPLPTPCKPVNSVEL